jgi:hypothetical protein
LLDGVAIGVIDVGGGELPATGGDSGVVVVGGVVGGGFGGATGTGATGTGFARPGEESPFPFGLLPVPARVDDAPTLDPLTRKAVADFTPEADTAKACFDLMDPSDAEASAVTRTVFPGAAAPGGEPGSIPWKTTFGKASAQATIAPPTVPTRTMRMTSMRLTPPSILSAILVCKRFLGYPSFGGEFS